MDERLVVLLENARGLTFTPEQIDESDLRIAVANGIISDGRVSIEALKAVRTVDAAFRGPKKEFV